jgi:hypothetical protein
VEIVRVDEGDLKIWQSRRTGEKQALIPKFLIGLLF